MTKASPWLRFFKLGVLAGVPLLAFLYAYQFTNQGRAELVPFKTFKAPDVTIVEPLEQKKVPLTLKAPITVVNFWATWCPPCVSEFPAMLELQRQLEGKGVDLIFISVDETWEAVEAFQRENVLDVKLGHQFWDPTRAASEKFSSTKFPETFVIRQDGWVVEKIVGEQRWTRPVVVKYLEDLAVDVKSDLAFLDFDLIPSAFAQKQLLHEDDKKALELLKNNIDTAAKNLLSAQAAVKVEQRSLDELKVKIKKEEEILSLQKAQASILSQKLSELEKALLKNQSALKSEVNQRKSVVGGITDTQKKIASLEKQLEEQQVALVEKQKELSTRNQNVESLEKANDVLLEDVKEIGSRKKIAEEQVKEKEDVVKGTQGNQNAHGKTLAVLESEVTKMEREVDKQKAKLVEFEEILNK